MYPVTQDFLEKVKAPERRILGRVAIDYTDWQLDQSLAVQANEQANISYPAQTANGLTEPAYKYAALDGSWVLGQDWALAPRPDEAQFKQMGWWGSQLAGTGGAFAAPYPALTVTHFSRPVRRLIVSGDSKRGEWPVDFSIKLYGEGDELLHTETVIGNTEMHWSKQLEEYVTGVIKQELIITKWSHEGRQVKILEFITSVQQTYEVGDLVEISLLEEREVGTGTIPVGAISANEITLKLRNDDRRFDADNTGSPLYQLLKPNRQVRAWLSAEAENLQSEKPPTFSRNSVAYKSDGTQVVANVPRFEAGKFGQAVMVEEGTTNLVPLDKQKFAGWSAYADATVTLTQNVSVPEWNATDATRIQTSGGTSTTKFHITLKSPSLNGQKYATSMKVKNIGAKTVRIADNLGGVQAVAPGASADIRLVSTGDGTRYYQIIFSTLVATDSLDFYAWRPQGEEEKAYSTSWHNSTRSPETLTIPTAGVLNPQGGTVECWVYVNNMIKDTSANRYIFAHRISDDANNIIALYRSTAGSWMAWTSNASGLSSRATVNDTLSVGWHYFAMRWSTTWLALFIDGAKRANVANPYLPSTLSSVAYIGCWASGSRDWINTLIDDLRISSRARTDAEIAAAYSSGQPLPVDEWTTCKLTFNGSIYPVEKVWVPLGTFWSLDWDSPDDTLEATVTARDRMELLRKSTYQSSQVLQDKSLAELAEIVLQDAGLTAAEYAIDPALQSITVPWAWFEPISHCEALRTIAEAGMATVYADRDGRVRIVPFAAGGTEPVMEIGPDQYFRADNPARYGQVANEVIVETQPLRPVDAAQEVYRSNEAVTVDAGQTVALTVHYNERPVIEAVASLQGATNTVIQTATYYGWGAEITLHNPGGAAEDVTLVISGKLLKVLNRERAVARDEDSIIELGTLCYELSNPLVQTRAVAQALADMILASVSHARRDIEIDWRGNPALELGDRIESKGGEFVVIRNELDWSGALRSRTIGRKA